MTTTSPLASSGTHATTSWHAMPAEEALAALGAVRAQGLAEAEVLRRLAQHGANTLPRQRPRSTVRMFLDQFTDVMVLVLIGAAVVAAVVGEPADMAAILAILVLNAILGFVQAYRAERAMQALHSMAAPAARVHRGGVDVSVPSASLVPGDIVLLEAGAIVPADLRVIEVNALRAEEAALTGESEPVDKTVDVLSAGELPVGDRRNMAFAGTMVSYGRGTGVVVATGEHTELGHIATLLRDASDTQTPLQQRLAHFGRRIALAVVALCLIIFAAGLLRGETPALMFMTALSLAVAAIPEALPAVVTVALALGARKMARQHALVRRLPAVETLGSVTYVCTDKTGTLTENRMKLDEVRIGADVRSSLPVVATTDDAWSHLLDAIALNNDAIPGPDDEPFGDPTETALYRAAAAAGRTKETVAEHAPRIAEVPFSSERSRMTTVHRRETGFVAYTKGAPERVLPDCADAMDSGGHAALDRVATLKAANDMAARGLRVLAVAMRRLPELSENLDDTEREQTFLGLLGLRDPPREEAREAVALCHAAGIHVVMITGDHPGTAHAVAESLGIAGHDDAVITGAALNALSIEELAERVQALRVYARVAPEDKIRIVRALQARGECVAMTGDGVNDAPALRMADIGVAMGRGGTDVAREAAHMVLLDDNFATIVKAVREGRRIFDNIRRFVRYALSTNSGEIWTLFLAPFVGLPLPLLPIHILWMNLVTDGLPGLALAAEPPERDVMQRPPRPPSESIFAHGLAIHALWVGLLMAGLALGTQAWALQRGAANWQSMTFTVLTLSQLAHALAIRSERQSLFQLGVFSNRALLGAVLVTFGLQMSTLYVPALNRVFRTMPLTIGELAACILVSSLVLVAVEIEKWLVRRGRLYAN